MTARWRFLPYSPGLTNRSSTADAFFDSDTVSDPGEALVREGVQNSLDATDIASGNTACVRISLIGEDKAPTWQEVAKYFDGVWPHYSSAQNGLDKEDIPHETEKCTALVFEDIGATGLMGDPNEPFEPSPGSNNHFYSFFRAEAVTEKGEGARGSRGIGKAAFIQASRTNTLIGLTIRQDDHRRMLMGRAVLRSHYVNGTFHHGDGYFGVSSPIHHGFTEPIEDDGLIDKFAASFRLVRENETGLSVVVPWPNQDIDAHAIGRAVFKNHFYPIIKGQLEIWVETSHQQQILDHTTILEAARSNGDIGEIVPIIELAEWAAGPNSEVERHDLIMTDPERAWAWDMKLFPDGLASTLREKLDDNQRCAMRVPVTVRKRGSLPQASYFDVFMTKADTNEPYRPLFIRDDVLISDVQAPRMRGVRALVVVSDNPLSAFLRKAENPSHTQWQRQRVKREYLGYASNLAFITRSVREIYNLIMMEDQEEDKKLLADIFPVVAEVKNGPIPPEPSPQYVAINRADGGFSVRQGRRSIPADGEITIYVAYDVRKGNPFKRYSTTDFQLDETPIHRQVQGAEIVEVSGNRIVARIKNPDDFRVIVTGFDPNRQICVNVPNDEVVHPNA